MIIVILLTSMSCFGSAVLLDEAAQTDITRMLTRDWLYRRALHTGGWRVSVSPTLVELSVATPGPWIGRVVKTYDYINRVVLTLPLSVYKGTWTTLSPLVAIHHHDLACA